MRSGFVAACAALVAIVAGCAGVTASDDTGGSPVAGLEGTTWEVTGYADGHSAMVPPIAGTALTLTFAGGAVSGRGGCNTFRAPCLVGQGTLAVGPAATTRKACPGEGVMAQERAFLAVLESATSWRVERERLELRAADGQRVLAARAARAAP